MMKPFANLSVAISTRDRSELLDRCLAALLTGQMLPAEIIVVDQSRDDQTRRVVEAHQTGQVRVKYLRHQGCGLAVSQNLAFAQVTCPIVAVTDDDCVPPPTWVARIEQAFALPDRVDVLTGPVLPFGPETPGRYAVASRTSMIPTEFDMNAMPWDIGSGNNFAVKRDWLNRIGGNDERLGPGSPGQGGVDMDLFYRLLRAGARIRYEPGALVYHERTSRAGRLARRGPYGYGMATCCSLYFHQGDHRALPILKRWLALRWGRLAGALRQRQWWLVYEEVLVLRGTVGGLIYGFRVAQKPGTAKQNLPQARWKGNKHGFEP